MGARHEFRRGAWLILATLVAAVSACAMPAQTEQMVPVDIGVPGAAADSPFRNAVALERVVGGEEPSPDMSESTVGGQELEEALRTSLRNYGYLSSGEAARFRLEVTLIELRRPPMGITMHGTSFMRYKLSASHEGRVVYDEVIRVSATKTGKDEFVGAARKRMLLEAIVRGNIGRFLRTLATLDAEGKAGR